MVIYLNCFWIGTAKSLLLCQSNIIIIYYNLYIYSIRIISVYNNKCTIKTSNEYIFYKNLRSFYIFYITHTLQKKKINRNLLIFILYCTFVGTMQYYYYVYYIIPIVSKRTFNQPRSFCGCKYTYQPLLYLKIIKYEN